MATAMITLTFCDVCLSEKDLEVPGQAYDQGGYQIDACDEHSAPLVEAQKLAEAYGSKGKRTPTISVPRMTGSQAVGAEGMACPVPGCGSVLTGRQSLGAHVRQQHGMTLGEAEGRPIVATCEICGAKFTTQNGHTLHTRQKHPEPAPKPRKRRS
jgi:hypothetical protein